ncbi:MAG TPA: hypothetical protein VEV17_14185 [Bryobacteraceae bacterium]|nr:hypothetical protein [Bryobacteraceae bacterium]
MAAPAVEIPQVQTVVFDLNESGTFVLRSATLEFQDQNNVIR